MYKIKKFNGQAKRMEMTEKKESVYLKMDH